MKVRAQALIDKAKAEVGYIEAKGNYTKYGKAYGMDGVYWCMIFVWWCFNQLGASELFYDGKKCASCSQLMNWAIKKGKWLYEANKPKYKPGDIIIYDFPGDDIKTNHVGICVSSDDNTVVTLEGNTSSGEGKSQNNGDGVYMRIRNKSLVVGAYRPDYEESDEDIVQNATGFEEKTMDYLRQYKYSKALFQKLANAIKGG